jgi:hypothetical protein
MLAIKTSFYKNSERYQKNESIQNRYRQNERNNIERKEKNSAKYETVISR